MSIINQMLKDLEKRSQKNPIIQLSGLKINSGAAYNPNNYLGRIIVCLLIATLFMLIWNKESLLSAFRKKTLQNSTQLMPITTPALSANQHSVPTVLTGITLQIQKELTDLRFLLSQDTLYRINYDCKQDKLIIFLEHSHLLVGLPSINYVNSAIKNMEMVNQTNGDLKIILTLNSGAELKHFDMQTKKFSELQIHLINTQPLTIQPMLTDIPQKLDLERSSSHFVKKLTNTISVQLAYQHALDYVNQGENQKAITLLLNLIEKYPNFQPARDSLVEIQAHSLVTKGKLHEALTLLQNDAPPLADNPDYHAFIAALYQREGQAMTSAKLYEQLITLNQNKAVWWIGLGMALESLGKQSEATHSYIKALSLADLTPELRSYIATRIPNV